MRTYACIWLCLILAGCPRVSTDDTLGEDRLPVRPAKPEQVAAFAPLQLSEGHPYEVPAPGSTYGLVLKASGSGQMPPKSLWVHEVTRELPGTSEDAILELARRIGFAEKDLSKPRKYRTSIAGDIGHLSLYLFEKRTYFIFRTAEQSKVDDTRSLETYQAGHKDMTTEAMFEIGRQAARGMRLWPEGMRDTWDSSNQHVRGGGGFGDKEVMLSRTFCCSSKLESLLVDPSECYVHLTVTHTGKLGSLRMAWRESRRYALLECKTIPEAFEALNRGYAHPLPKRVEGATAEFLKVVYSPGSPGSRFIHPSYLFQIDSPKAKDVVIVPAIRSAFFRNPERQVVLHSMGGKEEAK